MAEVNIVYKILVVGDGGVGKTCVIQQYTEKNYTNKLTIGMDFAVKTLEVDNKLVKLQIWDTAGQEKFRSIVRLCFRGSHGIILMYDIANSETFDNLEKWIKDIHDNSDENIPIILVGNKCDLKNDRQVEVEASKAFMEKYPEILFSSEISAKNSIKIGDPFIFLAEYLVRNTDYKSPAQKRNGMSENKLKKICCSS